MNLNTEPIKNWFGFSRRERRSSFTLLLIIVVILGIRYAIPQGITTIEDITGTFSESDLALKDSIIAGKFLSDKKPADSRAFYRKPSERGMREVSSARVHHKAGMANGNNEPQRQLIELNSSDSAALVELPLIGPVLAARIIKYRNFLGGFVRIEQLKEVYGLPEETFEVVKGRVFADSTLVKKININKAEYKEVSRIPYLEKYEVTSILKYRELSGRINSLQDLTGNKILTEEKAGRMGSYLKYED